MMALIGAQLASLVEGFLERAQARESPAIRAARSLIAARHEEDLHRPEVAQACGMSPGYFSRTFHRQTGMTFRSYVNHVRLDDWKRLLADPDRSISEAAVCAGFQSISQANRVFRAFTGCSPSAYRRLLKRGI